MADSLSQETFIPAARVRKLLQNRYGISHNLWQNMPRKQRPVIEPFSGLPVFVANDRRWIAKEIGHFIPDILSALKKFHDSPGEFWHEGFQHVTIKSISHVIYAKKTRIQNRERWVIVAFSNKGDSKEGKDQRVIDQGLRELLRVMAHSTPECSPLMTDASQTIDTPGGIDLDPSYMNMSVQTSPDSAEDLSNEMQTSAGDGFKPMIRAISPAEISAVKFLE